MSISALYKTASAPGQDEKQKLPVKPLLAAAAVKGLADIPKFVASGETEKAILKAMHVAPKGLPAPFSAASLKNTLKFARGASAGSFAGMATFPLMAMGIRNIGHDNSWDKTKGMAQVGGSALLYSGIKGAAEHGARHTTMGKGGPGFMNLVRAGKLNSATMKPYLSGAMAKAVPGTLSALIPAVAIAAGMGKKDEKASKSMMRAGIAGAVGSGLRGGIERALFLKNMGSKMSLSAMREITAAGGSKAASGLLGGVLLDRVVRMALKKTDQKPEPMKKKLEGQ